MEVSRLFPRYSVTDLSHFKKLCLSFSIGFTFCQSTTLCRMSFSKHLHCVTADNCSFQQFHMFHITRLFVINLLHLSQCSLFDPLESITNPNRAIPRMRMSPSIGLLDFSINQIRAGRQIFHPVRHMALTMSSQRPAMPIWQNFFSVLLNHFICSTEWIDFPCFECIKIMFPFIISFRISVYPTIHWRVITNNQLIRLYNNWFCCTVFCKKLRSSKNPRLTLSLFEYFRY